MSLLVGLSGCASTGTTKTVSTLAGSSAGAIAANAISVSGPWGYAVSLVSSALGGFAGDRVSRLFGGKGNDAQLLALGKVLESPQVVAQEDWGAQDGKASGGYAEATGPVFRTSAGANCRSFMLVTYKTGGLGKLDPAALQKGASAVGDAKSSAEKLGDVNNVGDAVSGAKDAAGAVSSAKETVAALSPGQTAAAPVAAEAAPAAPPRPAGKETFGTACKDAKNIWQVLKAK